MPSRKILLYGDRQQWLWQHNSFYIMLLLSLGNTAIHSIISLVWTGTYNSIRLNLMFIGDYLRSSTQYTKCTVHKMHSTQYFFYKLPEIVKKQWMHPLVWLTPACKKSVTVFVFILISFQLNQPIYYNIHLAEHFGIANM